MKPPNNNTPPQGYRMTELGALPEEWEVVSFESCIIKKNFKAKKIKQQDYKPYGKYPVIDQGQNMIAGYWDNKNEVFGENLPVIIFGDHTRIIKYIDFPFVPGADGTRILIPNISFISPKFFYYSLLNLKIPSRGYNRHFSLLREQKIPLPPLAEQQKIAAVLSAVQEAKEKTEAVISATKAIKKSMMKHLFTYGPVSPEETETVLLKETEIGPVPEDWHVVRLGEVAEKVKQKDPRRDPIHEFKYIDVSAISNDLLKITSYSEFLGKDAPHRARKAIQTNDIIFATVRPYLKRIAMVPENLNGQIASTAFCVIHCQKQIANPYYIFYTVSLDNFIKGVSENQRGSSYPAVTDKDILNQYIPLPPLPIQQKIASILSAIDAKIEAEENKKQALEELFKTLLDNLMTAKIRVNHLEVPS
ncbi:MAG TPA: restriction endonuclease subunit S [Paludibacter sp.]|jgi:type I restriction enzyme S subunit|nr:restriction endonuclease subunit S [Salinivirgaceae bacterium]HOS46322.1 restriction endonuclease subunit S [Paludibacter sp.]HPM10162.1 restriction endonuclease subunit S [Paludibacter sp.]